MDNFAPDSRFDKHGRALTIAGHGDGITLDIECAAGYRAVHQSFTVDDEHATRIALNLLERASTVADCDEIQAAIVALRALADREDAAYGSGRDDTDWAYTDPWEALR